MGEGYRTFDHTGDLGLEVWAESPERLYALAAEALLAQVAEARDGEQDVRRELRLDGHDPADLLVHWLNTALLESELERAIWTRASVTRLTSQSLEGVLAGPRRDPGRQVFLREIKAVSHHHLALSLEPPACRCRLVLDI
ncbi:MAG TPA: archease [Candidatus Limnocylindria bacterium]|nr:archease [Candidatus Limnocylindria bacterium]